mmetsp:Transcript_14149/g.36527  ORF Transcript_14149/g.36527 Transcript_14149/m.36527 type:complete len:142 (-) Transcript_14149:1826-2251(-)
MFDHEDFYPAQSYAPKWTARAKFTVLAYAYSLVEAGEDDQPFEFNVSAGKRAGWLVIKITSPRRGGLGPLKELIARVKKAVTDEDLDNVYGKPYVVITPENITDPMVHMDYKDRFKGHDHSIDLDHLKQRFGSITRIEDNQ